MPTGVDRGDERREPLGVGGEQVFRVPSLVLPATDTATSERLAETDAVRLFMDRARSTIRGWLSTRRIWRWSRRVCRRLDGIPLAIELAASAACEPCPSLRSSTGSTKLPTPGRRTTQLRERHKTMRATVDWSYELLTPR